MNTKTNMKYRYLNNEELEMLEEELKQFLIVNGIDGQEWEKINKNDPEKAHELIGIFSDVVLQSALEKIKYGELIDENHLFIFEFRENEAELVGLKCTDRKLKLSTFMEFTDVLTKTPQKMDVMNKIKSYDSPREEHVFSMFEIGMTVSNKEKFDFIKQLYLNA